MSTFAAHMLASAHPCTRHTAAGWTAVHWAVQCEEEDCVAVFAATRKVNCTITNFLGESPLHFAARTGNLNVRMGALSM